MIDKQYDSHVYYETVERAEAAETRVAELEAVLGRVSDWLVCYPIATDEDMAQSIPTMMQIVGKALSGSPAPVGEAERRLAKAAMVFLSTRTSADLENLRMKGDALAKARETGGE